MSSNFCCSSCVNFDSTYAATSYCLFGLSGEVVGTGSLSGDPVFVGAASGNYTLSSTSPAIGVGVTYEGIGVDLNNIMFAEPPSMGCYEYSARADEPTFDPASGLIFYPTTSVTLSCETAGAAIYYTTVMEIRRQGCSHLSATVRDMEAAAFLYKAKVIGASRDRKAEPFRVTDSSLEELIRLADQAGLDPKKLPYYGLGVCGLFYGRFLLSCENRVIVVKKNRVGFMDDTGKVVIPCKYNLTFGFNKGGYASVSLPNTPMWGYIDRNGKEVVPPEWRSVSYDTKDGKAYVCDESGNAYLIRVATGERILKMDGKYAVNNSFSLGDYVPLVILDTDGNVKEDTKLDIVDFDGNIVFHEVSVQEIDNLHMAIISDGKRVWSTDRHFY